LKSLFPASQRVFAEALLSMPLAQSAFAVYTVSVIEEALYPKSRRDQRVSRFQITETGEVAISAQQFAHAVLDTQSRNPSIMHARPGDFAEL